MVSFSRMTLLHGVRKRVQNQFEVYMYCTYLTRAFVAGLGSVVGRGRFCDVISRDVVLSCSNSACLWSMASSNNEGYTNDCVSF
jgi:hypothetical protein